MTNYAISGGNGTSHSGDGAAPIWLPPPPKSEGFALQFETVRERIWLVIGITLLSTLLAATYVVTAERRYEAKADLSVQPQPNEDAILGTIDILRSSGNPTQDVETGAQLVTTEQVAAQVKKKLEAEGKTVGSVQDLLDNVTAKPVGESSIVAVQARDPDPKLARDIANGFVTSLIDQRTEALHRSVDDALASLEAQEASFESAQNSKAVLDYLAVRSDPTLRLETPASVPVDPYSPRILLSLLGGLLFGLIAGTTAAFALRAIDPRLRREEQLHENFDLPILARVPREPYGAASGPLGPDRVSDRTLDAYRTLRSTLASVTGSSTKESRSVLITSAGPSEGKTTSAINLAASLAAAGNRVILIEADLRRPSVGPALGISAGQGVVGVLIEQISLEDALIRPDGYGGNLEVLVADHEGPWISELLSLPAGREMVEKAKQLADFVVVDSPPLTVVPDALPLVRWVDDVVLVVHKGRTNIRRVRELGELLRENGVQPAGFTVIGASTTPGGYYYADARLRLRRPHRGRLS